MPIKIVERFVDLTKDTDEQTPFEGPTTPCCSVEGKIERVYHELRCWEDDAIEFDWVSVYLVCPRCAKSYDKVDNVLFSTRMLGGDEKIGGDSK
jgi:hypothetical protein